MSNSGTINSKNISLYSTKKHSNRSPQTINGYSSSNQRNHIPRRSDSMQLIHKNFSPSCYELFDREKMEEDLSFLLREIKKRTKEYQTLKTIHNQTESENYKTLKLIETLISDCKQITNPIERHTAVVDLNDNKNQSLVQNLQDKLTSYQNQLAVKDEQLSELKTKNQKIVRLFEIETKLSEASDKYESTSKKYNDLVSKINELEYDIHKANEAKEFYLFSNDKLKQDNEEITQRIQQMETENAEMREKEKHMEDKNTQMKSKLMELKQIVKDKDEEIDKLKDNLNEYNRTLSEKEKTDQLVNNQSKQINLLKDQNEKKTKQLKDLEKQKSEYERELEMYQQMDKQPKQNNKLNNIINEKKKKEEELKEIKDKNEQLRKLIQEKKNSLKMKPFDIEAQISFNLGVPVKINV